MAKRFNESFNIERNSSIITVGDKTYTYAEWTAMRRKAKNAAKPKRKKKTYGDIQLLPSVIDELLKSSKVIKSLAAYYDNGYKQFGKCVHEIIDTPSIRPHFVRFRIDARELNNLLVDIDAIAKKRSKDIYQYVEKISYKLDDILTSLNKLMVGVRESRVCEFYKDNDCIKGSEDGRRLGLADLMIRTSQSAMTMSNTIKELMEISVKGADVSSYALNGSFMA